MALLPEGAVRQDEAVLWGTACPAHGSCAAVGDYYTDNNSHTSKGLIDTRSIPGERNLEPSQCATAQQGHESQPDGCPLGGGLREGRKRRGGGQL